MKTNKFEQDYKRIITCCLNNGIERDDRTGVGCYSIFNQSIKVDIGKYFPIITGRKIYQKIFNTEFDWFINGETNIERFQKAGVTIWDAWADKDGDLGPVYGRQMLNYNDDNINQLKKVIDSLMYDKDSRRHIISLWNPVQLHKMALPPCYLYFQFYVHKNELNMFVLQRSGDLFLGIPYDMCLFSKILLYVAEKVNLKASKLEIQIIDAHVYKNQIEAIHKYLSQDIYDLPTYEYADNILKLSAYTSGPRITASVAV